MQLFNLLAILAAASTTVLAADKPKDNLVQFNMTLSHQDALIKYDKPKNWDSNFAFAPGNETILAGADVSSHWNKKRNAKFEFRFVGTLFEIWGSSSEDSAIRIKVDGKELAGSPEINSKTKNAIFLGPRINSPLHAVTDLDYDHHKVEVWAAEGTIKFAGIVTTVGYSGASSTATLDSEGVLSNVSAVSIDRQKHWEPTTYTLSDGRTLSGLVADKGSKITFRPPKDTSFFVVHGLTAAGSKHSKVKMNHKDFSYKEENRYTDYSYTAPTRYYAWPLDPKKEYKIELHPNKHTIFTGVEYWTNDVPA